MNMNYYYTDKVDVDNPYTDKEYKEKYYNRVKFHENEYSDFNLESYKRGHNDGYTDGYNDMKFLAASLIYEHWDDFVHYCFVNEEDEMDCINNMIKFFTVNYGTVEAE